MVAAYRARATERGVIDDRWASSFAGDEGFADAEQYDRAHEHAELYIALRTAALDDEVRAAIARGVDQIVVLGAGYDSRAARLAHEGVRFFEIDHPATQRDKHERFAPGYPADVARYVACDFESQDFLTLSIAAGFDVARPALFVWEGVVYYLHEAAVRATLRRISSGADPRAVVIFDTVGKKLVEGSLRDPKDVEARDAVAKMGEPLRYGIDDPIPLLSEEGFCWVRRVSFDELALERTGTYVRARKFRFQALVKASVRPPEKAW
jgi:methyltransferase (TIGR00027 family)